MYTIGVTKPGPRNYLSIDLALADLYLRGLSGAITFEFTDESYTQTTTGINTPAIDLSSKIIGASSTNTITFKTTVERSINKAAVTINMVTESGIGVLLGQNMNPSNINAIQKQTYYGNAQNANSAGYITFDGGAQKSFRFRLYTGSNRKAVFYMGQRTNNISIMNNLILNERQKKLVPTFH